MAAPKKPASHPQERHAHLAHRNETRATRARVVHARRSTQECSKPAVAPRANASSEAKRRPRGVRGVVSRLTFKGCVNEPKGGAEKVSATPNVEAAGDRTRNTVWLVSLRYTLALAETCAAARWTSTTAPAPMPSGTRRGSMPPTYASTTSPSFDTSANVKRNLRSPPRSSRTRSSRVTRATKGGGNQGAGGHFARERFRG